jgi:hypothetical protein
VLVDIVVVMGDVFASVYNFHSPTQLDIKDDHYNVSDIIKQRIRCQLSNPS